MTLIVIIFAISSYLLIYYSLTNNLQQELQQKSQDIINNFIDYTQESGLILKKGDQEDRLGDILRSYSLSLRIIDKDKNIVTQLGSFKNNSNINQTKINTTLLTGVNNINFITNEENKKIIYLISPIIKNNSIVGLIELSQPTENAFVALDQLLIILIIGIVSSIIISIISGYILGRQTLSYVNELIDNVEAITSAHDLDKRLPIPMNYQDELTRLARTFNVMLDKIEKELHREKNFTSNVSHDLRTPLTIIQGNADLALKKKNYTPSSISKTLNIIKDETKRMSAIISDLLELSNIEKTDQKTFTSINLPSILEESLSEHQSKIKNKNLIVFYKPHPSETRLNIRGNYSQIKRMFDNLLDNSIKYSNQNGQIIIKISNLKNKYVVSFHDKGIGISAQHLPYIFDRHWQSLKSRTGINQGFGLGLSIVKEIANLHRAEILVSSKLNEGTIIKIVFPHFI